MPRRSASEADTPAPALIARFRDDWSRLTDGGAQSGLIVAYSGGPDSTALLLLAHAAFAADCSAATVDHGLRPESAHEARFAAAFCENRGIAHVTLAGPLPDRADRTANLSVRARKLRYDLLVAHARKVGAGWIATAHHADDQLETVVMRLNRAAGVGGLAGIRPVNGIVVRPLLEWRRAELTAIVAQAGVIAVADPTNDDDRYDRARLRKQLAGDVLLDARHVATSARRLSDAEEALEWAAVEAARTRLTSSGSDIVLMDPRNLPGELKRRLVRRALLRLEPAARPRDDRLNRLIAMLEAGDGGTLSAINCRSHVIPADLMPDGQPALRWIFAPAPPRRLR